MLMVDEKETMRVNVTLRAEDAECLARIMAAMPAERNSVGLPMPIEPADARRYCLRREAKRVR